MDPQLFQHIQRMHENQRMAAGGASSHVYVQGVSAVAVAPIPRSPPSRAPGGEVSLPARGSGGHGAGGPGLINAVERKRLKLVKKKLQALGFSQVQIKQTLDRLKRDKVELLEPELDEEEAEEELCIAAVSVASSLQEPQQDEEGQSDMSERHMNDEIDKVRLISETTASEDKARAQKQRECEMVRGNLLEDDQLKESNFLKPLRAHGFFWSVCQHKIQRCPAHGAQAEPNGSSSACAGSANSLAANHAGTALSNPGLAELIKDFKQEFVKILVLEVRA
mmetsp:Transcript_18947/g.29608  ORF Transcript_18947/g.29608 Transcript_18947/m.29608 type:complete len:279 (-) Transcript_18947:403-1239(-)